jgi:hypothetical protein
LDPAQVGFDPLEVEWIVCYHLIEMEALIQDGQVAFSGWFVQLIGWYLGRPSELGVLKTNTRKSSLLARSKPQSVTV